MSCHNFNYGFTIVNTYKKLDLTFVLKFFFKKNVYICHPTFYKCQRT